MSDGPSCSAFAGGMAELAANTLISKGSMSIGSGLLSNPNQFASDKIPKQLRSMKPLSENLNPIDEESFGREDDILFGRS